MAVPRRAKRWCPEKLKVVEPATCPDSLKLLDICKAESTQKGQGIFQDMFVRVLKSAGAPTKAAVLDVAEYSKLQRNRPKLLQAASEQVSYRFSNTDRS